MTDAEEKDYPVEEASTGWQLMEIGTPLLSILVVLLAFLVALPATGLAAMFLMFMCGGSPAWCNNPIQVLLAFIFASITVPPMASIGFIAGIFDL